MTIICMLIRRFSTLFRINTEKLLTNVKMASSTDDLYDLDEDMRLTIHKGLQERLTKAERKGKKLQTELEDIKQTMTLLKPRVSTVRSTMYHSISEEFNKVQQVQNSHNIEIKELKDTLSSLNPENKKIRFFSTSAAATSSSNGESTSKTGVKRYNSDENDSVGNASKKTHLDFMNENGFVVVYTDGACENNGKPTAKAGIGVWWSYNNPLNVSEPVTGKATNNVGEIQACIKAVNIALENGITKLTIKTDSQFVINSMTKWIKKWKSNNWKLVSGGDVKNREDFRKLDEACKKLQAINWEYVAGHAGHEGNEQADRLARAGATKYRGS